MRAAVFVLVLSSVLLIGISGCTGASGPAGDSGLEGASRSTLEAASTTTPGAAGVGTTATTLKAAGHESPAGTVSTGSTEAVKIGQPGERRNPIPLDQAAQVGDWKITVVGAVLDATQIILDENMFNAAPKEGNRYVLVSLEAVYLGGESSTFWLDMLCRFVGGKGGSYGVGAVVAPDSIMDKGEASPGTQISGNLVFEVPSDQLAGGTLMIEEAFSFKKARLFFAVE